jgi:hypothetical protein
MASKRFRPGTQRAGRSSCLPAAELYAGGELRFIIDAFGADVPFDPRRAEARSSISVWVWVMPLFVLAWAVWYAARMWDVPAQFADTSYLQPPGGGDHEARKQSCVIREAYRDTIQQIACEPFLDEHRLLFPDAALADR